MECGLYGALTFNGGQYIFTPDDFPRQRDLMGSENLTAIELTYRQQGEQRLLENYAQADQTQEQLNTLNNRLNVINEQLVAMDIQAAAQAVSLAASDSPVQQGLASIPPSRQIAWCWTQDPAVNNTRQVEVGGYDRGLIPLEADTNTPLN